MLAVLSLFALVVLLVGSLFAVHSVISGGYPLGPVLPFESGMLPAQHAVSRYHARWYPVTILFLAFDMEMIFMYPWAVVVGEMGTGAVVEMFAFLAVLVVGVVYVWREGGLRWT